VRVDEAEGAIDGAVRPSAETKLQFSIVRLRGAGAVLHTHSTWSAFDRWRSAGQRIAIFSSGSVLAQKNLFHATVVGDLSRFIEAYFDTTTGPKKDSASYSRIAAGLRPNPEQIGFVSDVTAELDAARGAGMSTILSKRLGNAPEPNIGAHPVVHSFDEIA
jgi:enolase-phosphatase E1